MLKWLNIAYESQSSKDSYQRSSLLLLLKLLRISLPGIHFELYVLDEEQWPYHLALKDFLLIQYNFLRSCVRLQ